MEWGDCKLLAIDLTDQQIVWIDNVTGDLITSIPYEKGFVPTGLSLNTDHTKACLSATKNDEGALFIIDLEIHKAYRLPLKLPAPQQFAICKDFSKAYLAASDATLYEIHLATLSIKPIARPEDVTCSALAISSEGCLHTVWENATNGILAIFSADGSLRAECNLDAVPTNLHLTETDILIPYTESRLYGEGLAVISMNADTAPTYLIVQPPEAAQAPRAYPCQAVIDGSGQMAYLVNEDSASITTIDLVNKKVLGSFPLGRSITNLCLLPDPRFAIASSNMFADLSYIDLINRKLLSITQDGREYSRFVAIV